MFKTVPSEGQTCNLIYSSKGEMRKGDKAMKENDAGNKGNIPPEFQRDFPLLKINKYTCIYISSVGIATA
jgi:hypothetical protein